MSQVSHFQHSCQLPLVLSGFQDETLAIQVGACVLGDKIRVRTRSPPFDTVLLLSGRVPIEEKDRLPSDEILSWVQVC